MKGRTFAKNRNQRSFDVEHSTYLQVLMPNSVAGPTATSGTLGTARKKATAEMPTT
jgi:hypothetical protein